MKNIINRCSDRCYQKPGSFNLTKTFYPNFNQSSILQQNNFRIIFSREDKDPRLRLTTVSFKSYTCNFKGSYNSKTVCCCGNTVRRKGINSKYFRSFSNKPPATWVMHIRRDFLTCYSCLYYSSMILQKRNIKFTKSRNFEYTSCFHS